MPITKIKDAEWTCSHPEHKPPMFQVFEPGATYRHTCPAFGKETVFTVPLIAF